MGLRERIIIIASILSVIVAVATTWYLSGGKRLDLTSPRENRKVSASRPAASNQTVRAIETETSKKQDVSETPLTQADDNTQQGADIAKVQQQVIQQALSAIDPEKGIRQIKDFFAASDQVQVVSELYSALGKLYTQTTPPKMTFARDAFNSVIARAHTAVQLQDAGMTAVNTLRANNDMPQAIKTAEMTLSRLTVTTAKTFQLRVILATMYEDANRIGEAEKAYEQAIAEYESNGKQFGAEAENSYVQACRKLAQLYRQADKREDAERIIQRFQIVSGSR